ncbi:PPC domain-containing protein [Novipirellula artificiosorum]|uniref:Peptidase C-terminal archaeal/bacterial domain-containing protein n=1 Tax=Novipirellula artificiosorum TaxID=2528016 RepID=A0A5C6D7H2_9BACT|nr:PPC domain-containing protein [Novipirellula artificiosorum]TWU31784.1 hypothetical protein Poly41_60190 [Novipirellula artificiosorum]
MNVIQTPFYQTLWVSLLSFAVAPSALGAFPVVERLSPLGVRRGEEATVVFQGKRLKDAHQLLADVPGITILDVKPVDNQSVEVRLKTDPSLAPGLYPVRLVTQSGIANLRLLGVGNMPVVQETEPNNDFANPQPVELNTTLEGVVDREDVDLYQVQLKAGQTLNVEIEGIRLAFSLNNQNILDPYIAILDQGRFELATSDDSALLQQDGVCSFTATEDGTYTVLVRDSAFGGNPICGYRLHLGTFPRPIATIPGGGVPDSTLHAKLVSLDGSIREASVQLPSGRHEQWPVVTEDPQGISPSPNWIRVNDLPVVMETEPNNDYRKPPTVTAPAALCGVIGEENDYDCFGIPCKKGERYRVTVFARAVLRSPLDAVLNVFGPDHKTLTSSDDVAGKMDPFLEFAAAADGMHSIRIYDHLRGGGPSHHYRIEVTRVEAEFDLSLNELRRDEAQVVSVPIGGQTAMMVTATRRGYNGEINMELAGLPDNVTATPYPIPAGRAEIPVLLTASADATHDASLFEIAGVGNQKDAVVMGELSQTHKLVLGQNRRGMWDYRTDRAAMAVTDAAPFQIELIQPKTPIVRSGSKSLVVRIVRDEGFDQEVTLRALYSPPGIGINNSRKIDKGKTEVEIPITANGSAALGTWPLVMIAGYPSNNGSAEIASTPIMLEIQDALFKYNFPKSTAETGSEAVVAVEVEVLRDLPGEAEVQLVGIPNGVTSPAAIQKLTKESTTVTFPILVAADAKTGNHKTLNCQSRVKVGDEVIVQTNGTGEIRIDKPLPPKVDDKPKPVAPPKPAEAKPAAPKPLSRLEQLRQMKQP